MVNADSYSQQEQEKLAALSKKVKDAVDSVAKENGYTYIFDSGTGVMLYMPEGDDVSNLVKKKLGITG